MILELKHPETLALTSVSLICAGASSAAFFLHVLDWLRMPFFINFVGLPLIVILLAIGIYAWNHHLKFWRRIRAGIAAGAAGLAAYDLVRYLVYRSKVLDYDPFHAIPILGSLITGEPAITSSAVFAGWLYHLWNGFSFAVIYVLIAGPARWLWGVGWAMILEIGMLLTYPSFLAIQASVPFIAISIIGHAAYGAAIGITSRRLA